MVRLSEIPREKLEEIERFVRENKAKYPVVSEGENLVDMVEREFGVRLSPQQIYRLQRGIHTVRVSVPVDVAEELERRYGSVGAGIKKVLGMAREMMEEPPARLRPAWEALRGRTLSYHDAVKAIADLGYEDPDRVIGELFRLGYGVNERGRLRFLEARRPPELALLSMFGAV